MFKLSLILLTFLLTTSTGFAEDVMAVLTPASTQYYLEPWLDFGGRVYYDCTNAEYQLKNFLNEMGAKNIKAVCIGGIQPYLPPGAWDATVYLKFSTLKLAGEDQVGSKAQWKKLSIRRYDNCHLLSQTFNRVKKYFQLRNINGPNTCMRSVHNFRVSFQTLKAL